MNIADDQGVVRMILSTSDEGETMVVHTPRSRLVTVMRNDQQKTQMSMKRLGIRLNRWKVFTRRLDEFIKNSEEIQSGEEMDVETHIGGGLYVTMSSQYPFLQFREFYRDDGGNPRAGRKGIRVTFDEMAECKCHIEEFNKRISGFEEIELCVDIQGHKAERCRECTFK